MSLPHYTKGGLIFRINAFAFLYPQVKLVVAYVNPNIVIAAAFTVRDSKTIYYDAGISSPFPIAHEIAHLILDHNNNGPENEEEANYAAGLLISEEVQTPATYKAVICSAIAVALISTSFFTGQTSQIKSLPPQAQQDAPASSSSQTLLKSSANEDDVVYITPSGIRYHLSESCAGPTATPTTLTEAENLGRTPCKICIGD